MSELFEIAYKVFVVVGGMLMAMACVGGIVDDGSPPADKLTEQEKDHVWRSSYSK